MLTERQFGCIIIQFRKNKKNGRKTWREKEKVVTLQINIGDENMETKENKIKVVNLQKWSVQEKKEKKKGRSEKI